MPEVPKQHYLTILTREDGHKAIILRNGVKLQINGTWNDDKNEKKSRQRYYDFLFLRIIHEERNVASVQRNFFIWKCNGIIGSKEHLKYLDDHIVFMEILLNFKWNSACRCRMKRSQ